MNRSYLILSADGKTVLGIDKSMRDEIESITIPSSVICIGDEAFSDCYMLSSVIIPNSVTSIGKEAFLNCSSLTTIVVEDGNPIYDSRKNCNAIIETATNTLVAGCKNTIISNTITSIGDYAFYFCESLTSITIPNSVTSIGGGAFSGCSGLTSITIPNSVTSIGDGAFCYCESLTSITIPNSVTSIGDGAFMGCSSLTSIIVESDNRIYDSRKNCNAIIETATNTLVAGCKNTIISNTITSIGDYAFYFCESLTSITIPNSVTSIGGEAFSDCSGLTSITIPNSVTSIGDGAFCYCESLTSITIPNSVTSIGGGAFMGCNKLHKIYVPLGQRDRFLRMDGLCDLEDIIEEIQDSCDSHVSNHQHKACSSCGKLFSSNFSFCPYCGAAQSKSCPCGAINIPLDAFFCPECGERL